MSDASLAARYAHIDTWVFDLDNTLYPADSRLFEQVSRRMTSFIMERFGLTHEAARAKQRGHFLKHHTTLRGLMLEDGIDPHEFLAHVHEIDLSVLAPDPRLDAALGRLKGRKLVYSNGSARHVERVLERLGIAGRFEAVFAIEAAEFVPKPDAATFARFVARYAIEPSRACMVEDIAINLQPALALGMATVLIAPEPAEGPHHTITALAAFLEAVAGADGQPA